MGKLFIALCILGSVSTSFALEENWKFGLGIGYSPNYTADLSGTGVSSGTLGAIDYDLTYEGGAEISFSAWYVPQNNWGFISGFQYGPSRKLKSGSFNGYLDLNNFLRCFRVSVTLCSSWHGLSMGIVFYPFWIELRYQ